ncbi:protein of unknown function [Candidatus Methylomirabilis oxygeniifera]|uniref:Uncharacterized protein n=1 Tax=Methylomirabilis oxygeniifera TaxID=671143 RepID=D5MFN8_METO1|nr:protein of unknown function [Candidatus Methylomirabilis oxyfera]
MAYGGLMIVASHNPLEQ